MTSDAPLTTPRPERSILNFLAYAVSIGAMCLALFALRDSRGAESAAGAGSVPSVAVTLTEFAIQPSMIEVPAGGAILKVTNAGSMVHNLRVPELNIHSGDIQPGATAEVRVRSADVGHYTVLCDIVGHADSGMKGSLMVSATGGSGGQATETTMSWEDMDRMMDEVAHAFPAPTERHGGQVLEPTIDADGAKRFDLTAEIVKWEVSQGKFVDAWTYNGVVPAPELRVNSGDTVRIVLTNKLPESTSMHLHGIKVPNSMDGVPPYTQPPITPGNSFTYEFVADGPAVGIYHSHHNSQVQVTNGLFGAITIDEIPIPKKLIDMGITKVDKKVNMVLNDAGTIGLSLNGKSYPATEAYEMKVGEVMQVHYLNEGLTSHPMHLHQPIGWVIAKDGIPLDEPIPGDTFNVAPGERYTVLYKATEPGTWVWHCHILSHAEGPTGMFGMVTALIVT